MRRKRVSRPLTAAAFLGIFLWAVWFTGCDLTLLWSRRGHLADIVTEMLPPEWGFAGKALPLLWTTVQMSVTGTVLGAALAVPAAHGVRRATARSPAGKRSCCGFSSSCCAPSRR